MCELEKPEVIHFSSVVRVQSLTSQRKNYLDKEWKVNPRSVFEYDPVEEGIESVSLGHLRNSDSKTVYEGYGQRDLLHSCSPKVKGIEPKPAISWVHRGTARWSNEARLADATSQFNYSGIKVNGVALDVETLMKAKNAVQARRSLPVSSSPPMCSNGSDVTMTVDTLEDTTTLTENRDVVSSRDTPDFVELPPSLPAPTARSHSAELFAPRPFVQLNEPLKVDQPLYKNFNRTPVPFGKK